jgi:adenosylcobinamide-phosphate synthase
MGNCRSMKLFYVDSLAIALAFLLDLVIGDPKKYHPISGIGKLTQKTENFLRGRHLDGKLGGLLLFLIVCSITLFLSIFFIKLLSLLSAVSKSFYFLSLVILIIVSSLFLALKGLILTSSTIDRLINENKLYEARNALKALVGRDTENLTPKQIRIAVVESLSENLSDAVIAPLFYFLIGGFPFLVLYKTVNTLDSMVGYKNEKYKDFGWFSARMDDVFNFIPARITGLMIVLATLFIFGAKKAKDSFRIMLRDGRKHLSPNSGIPEAAMAGALGIRLGGPNYYHGILVEKPYIGEEKDFRDDVIKLAQKVVVLSSFLFLIIALGVRSFIW